MQCAHWSIAWLNLTHSAPTEKRICVLAAPGDRRDEDIVKIASIAANRFDRYICKRDDHRRGRGDEEVPLMLKNALIENGGRSRYRPYRFRRGGG